jgi:hypothetical protein
MGMLYVGKRSFATAANWIVRKNKGSSVSSTIQKFESSLVIHIQIHI